MQQRKKMIINLCLAVLLAGVCALSAPSHSMAHVTGSTSWSVPLPVAEEKVVTSDLLVSGGQDVQLALLEYGAEREVEIPVYIPEGFLWEVSAVTGSDDIWASVRTDQVLTYVPIEGLTNTLFYEETGEQMVYLTLRSNVYTDTTPTYDEDGNEVAVVLEDITATVTVTLRFIEDPREETVLHEVMQQEVIQEESLEQAQEELQQNIQQEQQGTAAPVELEALEATCIVPLQRANRVTPPLGTLSVCPRQYNPAAAISLLNGEAESELQLLNGETESEVQLLNGEFPAMTRYTIDERTCILYDGGTIVLPANAAVALDLSRTELNAVVDEEEVLPEPEQPEEPEEETTEPITEENTPQENPPQERLLTLLAGGREYALAYAEAPTLEETKPLIMAGRAMLLPLRYLWNDITPAATVEKLRTDGETPVWEKMDDSVWQTGASGTMTLLTTASESVTAGTYRLTVSWIENEITVYSLQTVFYVRSGNL